MRLCAVLLLPVLCLQMQIAGQELPWDKNVEQFFDSVTLMYDQWSHAKPGRLEPAYKNLQVVLQRHPANVFFIRQKILLLAEMGRWSELEGYLETLTPLASSDREVKNVAESTRIHIVSRQNGLLSAFSAMSTDYQVHFLSTFFGGAIAMSLIVWITAILARAKWQRESITLPVGVMLFVAWVPPVAHLAAVSIAGGLYPIRPYDHYRQNTLSLAIQTLLFLAAALFYRRRYHSFLGTGALTKSKLLLLTLAILLPVFGLLPYVSWSMVEALPQNVANLRLGINVFFGAIAVLQFLADVGFGLLVYCILYTSIRSMAGAASAIIWLTVWTHCGQLWRYIGGEFLPGAWVITCFGLAPAAAYEARSSAIAPIAALWWVSLLRIAYGIAGSGGWNPSLLL